MEFTYFSDKNCSLTFRDNNFELLNLKNHGTKATCENNQMVTAILTDEEIKLFSSYFFKCATKSIYYRFKTSKNLPACWNYFKVKPNSYPRMFVTCDMSNNDGMICKKVEKNTNVDYTNYIFGGISALLFLCIGASVIIYKKFKKVLFK